MVYGGAWWCMEERVGVWWCMVEHGAVWKERGEGVWLRLLSG